ncbi:metallophosphoesterase family protein [Pediococcus acidilactici]|uniref:metallophosphoesterase family protein n=1 Tax=Pediococcus acidilactici TaxID=1254 RepID=UPI001BD682A9|nr:metallophosphoesterase [Pediococcus acidilactici]MBS9399929.1 metallophosphoesterase [Pediococcus acidilactici]
MNYTGKITRIIVDMYKPNGTKNNVDVYDMSDSFNARVGDEQIPLMIEYRERGIIERMTSESLTPFAMGYVGQPDEHGKVTAETGVAVSYHGSSDDIIGGGKVKMDLPGAMFPQEGMFYGFFGLENSAGKRITSNDVCFEVKNGNPDMYVDSMPFRSELQKLLDEAVVKADTTIGDIKAKWETLRDAILEMIKQGDTDLTSLKNRIGLAEDELAQYEKDLAAGKGVNQEDLDKSLEPLNELTAEFNAIKNVDVSVDGGVVEPFKSNLSNFASTINTDDNVARIGLLQDIHYQRAAYKDYGQAVTRGLVHIQHVGMLKDYLDMAVYNGDNVHGREMKDNTIRRIKQLVSTHRLAFGDTPTMWTIGNHDDNNIYFEGESRVNNIISLNELGSALQIDKTYGYHDLDDKKLRVIVLDSFENPEIIGKDGLPKYTRDYNSVFSATQIKWLIDALKVPAGYSVVIFTHAPLVGFYNNKPYADYTNVNHDIVLGIVKAYINGSSYTADGTNTDYPVSVNVDYSNQGKGLFVAMIFGHEHWDGEIQTVDGIRGIERTCNLAANRNLNEIDEDAFDVIEIDTANKHCKFNRFGSGNSLEFDY